MSRTALGAACLALWAGSAIGACVDRSPTALTERFTSADCAACWSSGSPVDGAVLDWVVPGADGAPLADKALAEAAGRAAGLPVDRPLVRQSMLDAARLRVVDGFALGGYIGLQLEVTRGAVPPAGLVGLVGYMALVERIAAGRDGTPVDRQLVRAVVGPLSLAELASRKHVRHLAAVRVPAMAQPERLASVGWLEDAGGRVVAFVSSCR